MTATAPAPAASTTGRSLRTRAATAAAAAVAGNLVLSQVLAAVVDADPDFLPLQAGPVAASSLVGVALGLLAYVVLRRLRRERAFVGLVLTGAVLSLGGPLSLLGATPAEQPGVTDGAVLALLPLHLLVGVVVALLVPARDR